MKGVLHESKEGLVYVTGINAIVVDYVKKYQESEEWFKKLLEKYQSPVSVMTEFYRMMVNQNQFEPIEKSDDKQAIWDEVKDMDCDRNKKIKIAKAIYSIKMILK